MTGTDPGRYREVERVASNLLRAYAGASMPLLLLLLFAVSKR
jgi:hypothetical protein